MIYVERDGGYFIKSAPKGALKKEYELGKYFHGKGLTAPALEYLSLERDWMLTERVKGEDATNAEYLSDPQRLASLMGEMLRELHESEFSNCPVQNRMDEYFTTVEENFKKGQYDLSYGEFSSAEEAYRVAVDGRILLKSDTLIHGDFCLPNFVLDGWRLSGFIDLGNGGVGDRHIDLFWGAWTLNFNLKTENYRNIFFDAYGRDKINNDALRVVSAAECFG